MFLNTEHISHNEFITSSGTGTSGNFLIIIIMHIKLVHSEGNMDLIEFRGPLATFGTYFLSLYYFFRKR